MNPLRAVFKVLAAIVPSPEADPDPSPQSVSRAEWKDIGRRITKGHRDVEWQHGIAAMNRMMRSENTDAVDAEVTDLRRR